MTAKDILEYARGGQVSSMAKKRQESYGGLNAKGRASYNRATEVNKSPAKRKVIKGDQVSENVNEKKTYI